ncbi:MAG TPA: glutamate synthase [Gammaproteobacteria bacterium]|nr:glutamate synthase [Gammaproteobacteria bacterium]
MGKPTGFMESGRTPPERRATTERIYDYNEYYHRWSDTEAQDQGSRCMDCAVPFCHMGCPLGNVIPEFNHHVYKGEWEKALKVLLSTNNFPEFTGTLCPAPCEGSCVLGINDDPVTIKAVELSIINYAFAQGWVRALPPKIETGKRVAIVGSGPAGLAAAQQLRRAGHDVVVFERADRIGGLLRYGIPEFKMEKWILDRRLRQMADEGIEFRVNVNIGIDIELQTLREEYDAVALASGATKPRDLKIPGRELGGVHFAMDFLTAQNRICEGEELDDSELMSAGDKHVIIIGGGDTGADCLGTSHRHKAKSIHQLEIMPHPPGIRGPNNPWPEWPHIYRIASAHEEGGERVYSVSSKRFIDDGTGQIHSLEVNEVETKIIDGKPHFIEIPGSVRELRCDLALIAMGFTGPEKSRLLESSKLKLSADGNVWRNENWMTSEDGIFAAGDMQRGQSLIVWAIADGRSAARGIDKYLMGDSDLPAPLA